MKIAHVLESLEKKRGKTCFSLDFSQLRMHFSSVLGILPELTVIVKDNFVFTIKERKPCTRRRKNCTRTPLKILGYGTKISILRDISSSTFRRSVAQVIYHFLNV